MSKISQEYPFLNHLEDKTTLMKSRFFLESNARWDKWITQHQQTPDAIYHGYVIGFATEDDPFPELVPIVWTPLNETWAYLLSRFRSNVALVTTPFMAACKQAAEAFQKDPVTTKSFLAGKTFSGTVLVPTTRNTVGYSVSYDDYGNLRDYNILWLGGSGSIFGYIVPGIQFMSSSVLFGKNNERNPNPLLLLGDKPLHPLTAGIVDTINSFLLFCHFAEITDDFVARPGSRQAREQAGLGETCVNDTRYNVRRLSVAYFKNICRDEDFPVRGHFRMQPYGVGRAHRRLVYIEPFVKHGYHRRAELLTVGEFGRGIKA